MIKKRKTRKKSNSNVRANASALMVASLLLCIFILSRSFIITVIFALAIMIVFIYLQTPAGKGKLGELAVRILIGKNKPKKDKYGLHNLTFYDGSKSVQVDHIVINRQGVHVIETKNYAGLIYGDDYSKQWTQVLAYGKIKYKVYNPIHQNYGHIMSLKSILNIDENKFHSYVVFTGRATLKNSYKTPVLYPININKSIKTKTEKILTSAQVLYIYESLLEVKKSNTISNKVHIESVNERIKTKESKEKI